MALGLALAPLPLSSAWAYTAAGDRQFPATIILPQIAPTDELYLTPSTQPFHTSGPGSVSRETAFNFVYDKTIAERWGLTLEDGYSWLNRVAAPTVSGAHNIEATLAYTAVIDREHEFLFSLNVDREFGASGSVRAGADREGATTPFITFGKGLGDLDIGWFRPLAITGLVGFQAADGGARANLWQGGVTIEYSIPYLESKVANLALPDVLRSVTPMVEILFTTPTRGSSSATTIGTVAPGFNYAGEGWDFGLEALVPTNRASGSGLGVAAQLHLSLDFLFPDSLGKPLF